MKPWIAYIAILTLALGTTFGCSMCQGPYDYDYPNFGGKHQRVDPTYGRVGSIFSDPNANSFGPSADSNLKAPEPPRATNIEDTDTDIDEEPDLDLDAELQEMRNELKLEGSPEEIEPMLEPPNDTETLPDPDSDGPTASRRWQNRPLRPGQVNWR